MKKTLAFLALTTTLVATSAIAAYSVPTDALTTLVFDKNAQGAIEITTVVPGPGTIGIVVNEAEVTRIIETLKTLGITGKKASKNLTVYEGSDVYCFQDNKTECSLGKKKLKLSTKDSDSLIQVLIDYKGTQADFENYAEFALKKISCTVQQVPELNTVYRQCNLTY